MTCFIYIAGLLKLELVAANKPALYMIYILPPAANIIVLETYDCHTGKSAGLTACGSTCFRIPALITRADSSLFAAADAHWNTTYDGGGLDTIVARSDTDGENWKKNDAHTKYAD